MTDSIIHPFGRHDYEKQKLCLILQSFSKILENQIVTVFCSTSTHTYDVIKKVVQVVPELSLEHVSNLELVEVLFSDGMSCKERCLQADEFPLLVQGLWPCSSQMNNQGSSQYKFVLRPKFVGRKTNLLGDIYPPDSNGKYLTGLMTKRRVRDYQDLCNLPELNESTLIENLKRRFMNNSIYTYIGSILISINPFFYFPIYNPKFVEMYQNKRLIDLPPHIFAIADTAYYNMVTLKKNQCIVISGESGSGKTENANFLLHHLSALSQRNFYSSGVEKHIGGVGPVLEAFGNAKTIHNNNSSRFGKFVQVSYREDGTVYGATVEKYLLEKSRIVFQAAGERNYHVFYYLLIGASEADKKSLYLTKPEDYFYLNQNEFHSVPGDDGEVHEFNRLKNAMDAVGFSAEVQNRLFVVLSAILHLGNIQFRKRAEHGHHDECVAVKNMEEIVTVSSLLKVKEVTLLEALTKRRTMAGGEVVVMSNKLEEAFSTRNATAKCLYSALFDWIVFKINTVLLSKCEERRSQGNCIGVLDIFGFEDFETNSFEQFCINYANENLHYYFNQHIFKLEQEEYTKEGIAWKNIEFIDNTGCLELFNKRPAGLLHLLDEESNFPGATNETLLTKFHSNHSGNAFYDEPQMRQNVFSIVHYAGKVKYRIEDFREKNIDLMRNDILILLKSSKMSFMKELVGQDPMALMRWSLLRIFFKACFAFMDAGKRHRSRCRSVMPKRHLMILGEPRLQQPMRRSSNPAQFKHSVSLVDIFSTKAELSKRMNSECMSFDDRRSFILKPKTRNIRNLQGLHSAKSMILGSKMPLGARTSKSKNKPPSISAQFHASLLQLTETLNQATPSFIRCIKSNNEKAAKVFDEEVVQRQLRYTGMLATVKIRQSGYNCRISFEDFVYHFHLLLPSGKDSTKKDIEIFFDQLNINKNNFQIGKTKVFLREIEKLYLEEKLHEALLSKIIVIQNWLKAKQKRRIYIKLRCSIILAQSVVRRWLARRRFVKMKTSSIVIQSWFRAKKCRRILNDVNFLCSSLQRCARTYLVRTKLARSKTNEGKLAEISYGADFNAIPMIDREQPVVFDSCVRRSVVIRNGSFGNNEAFAAAAGNDSVDGNRTFCETTCNVGRVSSISRLTRRKSRKRKKTGDVVTYERSYDDLYIGFEDIYEKEVDNRLSQLDHSRSDSFLCESLQSGTSPYDDNSFQETQSKLSGEDAVSNVFDNRLSFPASVDTPRSSKIKSLSISSQAGPEDIEIEIRRVIVDVEPVKSVEENYAILRCKSEAFQEKKIRAPLAVPECVDDLSVSLEYGGFETRTLSIDREIPPGVDDDSSLYSTVQRYDALNKNAATEKEENHQLNIQGSSSKQKPKQGRRGSSAKKLEQPAVSSWNVSSTAQWKYPLDLVVENLKELRQLEHYLSQKMIYTGKLNKERGNKNSVYDEVFRAGLTEFHSNLISQISTAKEATEAQYIYSYERLMKLVEDILRAKSRNKCQEDGMLVLINAFRGFLDEFIKKKENKDLPDIKSRKFHKKTKKEAITEQLGHKFVSIQFNIPTFCEMCQSKLWVLEKGYTCKVCKLTIHKKCFLKLTLKCGGQTDKAALAARLGHKIIGSPLDVLARDIPEGYKVHPVIERLMTAIEMEGLYTEGLYRKPGAALTVKQLIKNINNDSNSVDFKTYPIHVLTAVLKAFFREMPEPLMTFEYYQSFIRSTDIEDEKEKIQSLYSLVRRLPQANHDLLERLIFHLSKVALQEDSTRMSASGLAIIFAPSILRTSQNLPMQESFLHVPRQSSCVQSLIEAQMQKTISTLLDIEIINKDAIDVTDKLKTLRARGKRMSVEELKQEQEVDPTSNEQMKTLTYKMKSLQRQKQALTEELPVMSYRRSFAEEGRFSSEEGDSVLEDLDEDSDSVATFHTANDRMSECSDAAFS